MSLSGAKRIRSTTWICLLIVLVGSLLVFTHVKMKIPYTNVDTYVLEKLAKGERVVVYAVVEPECAVHLPPPLRGWRFGDYLVLKYIATHENIQLLSRYSIYISSPRPLIPTLILLKNVGVKGIEEAKKYPGDVKLDYHKDGERWKGRGVTVCIIDSGIDYLHPDLTDRIVAMVSTIVRVEGTGAPVVWIVGVNGTLEDAWAFDKDVYNQTGTYAWMDLLGHGTHVAGCIAGTGNASSGRVRGFIPEAKLVVIKAFFDTGLSETDIILDSLDWVEEHYDEYNITVVNLSFGLQVHSNGLDPVSVACDALADKGLVLVAAAGNNYVIPFSVVAPGCARKVLCIGAINPYTDKVPAWSSIGPTADGRIKPDYVCAGEWILSTKPVTVVSSIEKSYPELVYSKYYMYLSGTSMATAVASGVVGEWVEWYLYSFRRGLSWRSIYAYLKKEARRINPLTKDFITGEGVPYCPGKF